MGKVKIKPRIIKKNDTKFIVIFLIVFILAATFIIYNIYDREIKTDNHEQEVSIKNKKIKDLYNKVKLSKEEDFKFAELNDETKLYLAYRQIPKKKFMSSECSLFSEVKLEKNNDLYMCDDKGNNSFKKEDLEEEYHKLFGDVFFKHKSIISKYEIFKFVKSKDIYIKGKYLGGSDDVVIATKRLVKAFKVDNKLYLLESVNYTNKSDGKMINNSKHYKSGTYKYTFKIKKNKYIYQKKELIK